MRLVFLGTGAGVPSRHRNVAGLLVEFPERGRAWLVDAGEGTQLQLMKTTLSAHRIERIFITHLHGDHLFGLPGVLSSRSFQDGVGPLDLYGPPGIAEYAEASLRLSSTHLTYDLTVHEVADGDTLFHEDGYAVTTRLLDHVVPSFGYRMAEDPRPGALAVDRLVAQGLGPGKWYGELKAGRSVTLPDGRVVDGRDYLGPARPGRVVAITGDTRGCAATVELARGADVLVHESTYASDLADRAGLFGHSTAPQAAGVARAAGVGTLLLTHISARYGVDDLARLADEACAVFPNTVVMRDLDVWDVPGKE